MAVSRTLSFSKKVPSSGITLLLIVMKGKRTKHHNRCLRLSILKVSIPYSVSCEQDLCRCKFDHLTYTLLLGLLNSIMGYNLMVVVSMPMFGVLYGINKFVELGMVFV
jgi:hypothetical protein